MNNDAESFKIRDNPQIWFEVYGTILNRAGELIRPTANSFQSRVFAVYRWCRDNQKPCRIIILKPRRKGSSTVSLALAYTHLRNYMGYGAVLGDDLGTTAKLMETWNRYVEHDKFLGWGNEPGLSKRNFSHGSKVYEETANDPRAGMGGDIHFLLASEAAHYRSKGKTSGEYVMQSVMNSVPNLPQSCVIIESTPNGTQGVFYTTWQSAVSFEELREPIQRRDCFGRTPRRHRRQIEMAQTNHRLASLRWRSAQVPTGISLRSDQLLPAIRVRAIRPRGA